MGFLFLLHGFPRAFNAELFTVIFQQFFSHRVGFPTLVLVPLMVSFYESLLLVNHDYLCLLFVSLILGAVASVYVLPSLKRPRRIADWSACSDFLLVRIEW